MNLWCLSSIFSLEFTLMYDIFKIFWRCSTICCCINYIPILLFTKFWIYLVMNGVSREFVNMLIVFIVFIDSVGCSLLFIICVKYILGSFSYCWKIFHRDYREFPVHWIFLLKYRQKICICITFRIMHLQ